MKYNQKTLELEPRLSKLIDSLCFELAVNIPDENSLSLLEILDMRKSAQITDEEFKQLYKDWLQSKNIFDIFSAKQVRIFPKNQLISGHSHSKYLDQDSVVFAVIQIVGSLELLNSLYNQLCLSQKGVDQRTLHEIETLFQFLDTNGNIHLNLSSLFFLTAAQLISENSSIPLYYQQFKVLFKRRIKEFCEVQGMVSLRWFKNYFIFHSKTNPKQLLGILKDIQKGINPKSKRSQGVLPDILTQTLIKWRNTARFSGLFQAKKKKFQIYQRIFIQNYELFFFNGKEQNILNINTLAKKYGETYMKSVDLDTPSLREFGDIMNQILNEYLSVIAKVSVLFGGKVNKSSVKHLSSAAYQTPTHQSSSNHNFHPEISNPFKTGDFSHKKNQNSLHPMTAHGKVSHTSYKAKTPTKKNKGNETRRYNATPTNRNTRTSPLISRNFGSTQKSRSKSKNMTPTKNYPNTVIPGHSLNGYPIVSTQIYKNSKKEGLEKDSVYQKLFFFRNKRVQSFDIVMKRLKGR